MAIDKDTGLSDKQRAFCDYYIANGCNGAQAAKDAGYNAGTDRAFANIASKNLTRPAIQEYIATRLKSIESSRIADADEAMQIVTNIARGTDVDPDGNAPAPMTKLRAAEILLRVYGMFNDRLTVRNEGPVVLAGDDLVPE